MLSNFKNSIDFFLRNLLKISRPNFSVKNESKEDLFEGETLQKAEKFCKKYNLNILKNNSTKRNYAENLYTLDLLETFIKPEEKNQIKALDIGSKNWFYVSAEYAFFSKFAKNLKLDGIEIDAWRVYSNFYSRHDAAMFYSKNLDGTKYIAGDFLKHKSKYDYIIWILPFVSKTPLKAWGLPMKHFKPHELLQKAYNDLEIGGQMLIVNQGEKEYTIQQQMYDELKIPYEKCGEFKSEFLEYQNKRFVSLIKK